MPAIPRAEYPVILDLVDVQGKRTSEVAARYGVVSRTINIVLGKARAEAAAAGGHGVPLSPADAAAEPVRILVADSGPCEDVEEPEPAASVDEAPAVLAVPAAAEPGPPASSLEAVREPEAPPAPQPVVRQAAVAARQPVANGAPARSLLKQGAGRSGGAPAGKGFGLAVRDAEGDENVAPFGTLDELLAAAKTVLRQSAGRDETVWLAVRRVDLADFADAA